MSEIDLFSSVCQRDDLKVVVSHLRSNKQISRIGLWGRSMGAVTRYFGLLLLNLFLCFFLV